MLEFKPQRYEPKWTILRENQVAEMNFNVPDLPFPQAQQNEISAKRSPLYIGVHEGVILGQNNFLQQITQVGWLCCTDDNFRTTGFNQSDSTRNPSTERGTYKSQIDTASGIHPYIIDQTCTRQSKALDGLESFAGAQLEWIRSFAKRFNNSMDTHRSSNRRQRVAKENSLERRMERWFGRIAEERSE